MTRGARGWLLRAGVVGALLGAGPACEPDRAALQTQPRAGHAGTPALRAQNAETAATLGVTAIADAAPAGLGLDGAGVRIGVWDDAHARDSHLDLRGRVQRRDVGGFGEHATHTTATLAGDGTADPRARGMATAARVWAYDWLLDLAELEEAAPALSVSSHAYGPTLGWSTEPACPAYPTWRGAPSAREDAAFGRYDEAAAALDAIALRTDLLTVWPASNERADTGPMPGESHYHLGSCSDLFTDAHLQETTLQHDTLAGLGVAKNAIMVGAVRAITREALRAERIVPLDVSGFGPTDDGRIKPELVAVGDRVRSASAAADDAYSTATGTSSATAAVAGATALLTQLHRQLNQGADLRAAALKALLVHTARDAGEPGPDVGTGYGLLDAQAAADLLVADANAQPAARHLLLGALDAGETLILRPGTDDTTEDGSLRVTLAWLDPPAEPARGGVDDQTATLVDDLDLVVVTPDGRRHLPWSLEPSTGARARDSEPNRTDNLERVDVPAIGARGPGQIEIRVQAPSALRRAGPRAFALVASLPLEPPAQPVLLMPRYVEAARPAQGSRVELRAQLASQDGTAFAFSARALQPWLAVSPTSGQMPTELVIEADLEALGEAREALGQIVIESEDPSGARVLGVVVRADCEPACEGVGCGPDPRCGVPCQRCDDGELCEEDRCVALGASCPHGDLGAALGVALVTASTPASAGDDSGSCGGEDGGETAFDFRPERAGRYAVTTRGSARDTVLYARSGGCTGEELACNDDSGGVGSALGLTLGAAERVAIFVDTFGDGESEPFALGIEPMACPSASLGSRLGQSVAIGATEGGIDFLAGSCGGEGSEEARFAWTAPYTSTFRFALFQPRYQAVLYVRDGGCDGDELGCSFATDVGPVEIALEAGQTVAVIVDGRDGRSGPFTLDVVDAAPGCDGACGAASADGRCACDAACVAAGDCCADACERCGACRCEQSCDGKRCGPDGCGGECGTCGPGLACDDGACVLDPCDGVDCEACEACVDGRCAPLEEGAACEDGDPCSVLDACEEGECVGDARDCDDGFACTLDMCDARSGRCVSHEQADCCDAGTGCGSMSLADGGSHPAASERSGGGCACDLARDPASPASPESCACGVAWLLAAVWLRRRARSRRVRTGGRIGEGAG